MEDPPGGDRGGSTSVARPQPGDAKTPLTRQSEIQNALEAQPPNPPPKPRLRRRGTTGGAMWVDQNYEAMARAKELNGGVLPYSRALETTDFPHKDEWSEENLPDILFYLVLPESKYKNVEMKLLFDNNGEPVKNQDGDRQLRDIEILPRRISLDVEAWLIEAWRRIDCRITYNDILDRQETDPDFGGGIGLRKLDKNALQNHCHRSVRRILNAWVEYGRRGEPHRTDVQAIENLSYSNIVDNTSLHRNWDMPGRLEKVRLRREKPMGAYVVETIPLDRDRLEQTSWPRDYFRQGVELPSPTEYAMSKSMVAAWELLILLTERAEKHGLDDWQKLKKSCVPASWYDRTKHKTTPNDTYDGGCEICTWHGPGERVVALKAATKRARTPHNYVSTTPVRASRKKSRPEHGSLATSGNEGGSMRADETSFDPTPLSDDDGPQWASVDSDTEARVTGRDSMDNTSVVPAWLLPNVLRTPFLNRMRGEGPGDDETGGKEVESTQPTAVSTNVDTSNAGWGTLEGFTAMYGPREDDDGELAWSAQQKPVDQARPSILVANPDGAWTEGYAAADLSDDDWSGPLRPGGSPAAQSFPIRGYPALGSSEDGWTAPLLPGEGPAARPSAVGGYPAPDVPDSDWLYDHDRPITAPDRGGYPTPDLSLSGYPDQDLSFGGYATPDLPSSGYPAPGLAAPGYAAHLVSAPGYAARHARPAPLSLAPRNMARQFDQPAPATWPLTQSAMQPFAQYGSQLATQSFPPYAHQPWNAAAAPLTSQPWSATATSFPNAAGPSRRGTQDATPRGLANLVDHYEFSPTGLVPRHDVHAWSSPPLSALNRPYVPDRRHSMAGYPAQHAPQSALVAPGYASGYCHQQAALGHVGVAPVFGPRSEVEQPYQPQPIRPATCHLSQIEEVPCTSSQPTTPQDILGLKYLDSDPFVDDTEMCAQLSQSVGQQDDEDAVQADAWRPIP